MTKDSFSRTHGMGKASASLQPVRRGAGILLAPSGLRSAAAQTRELARSDRYGRFGGR